MDTTHFADAADDLGSSGADLLADAAAGANHIGLALQRKALDGPAAAALYCFGSCLQDVQLVIAAVFAPLDIHRAAIVLFDRNGHAREFDDVFVAQRKRMAVSLVDIHGFYRPARGRVVAEYHLDRFAAEVLPQDRVIAVFQRRLVNVELVGIDGALDDRFAEAVGRGDEYRVAEPGFGIQSKDDAGRTEVAADHHLHAGRQGDLAVVEALVYAVRNRAVVEQRGEYLVHGCNHIVEAAHIQVGLLLSGERRVGKILCGRR